MTEPTGGLLDTSVVIDHDVIDPTLLPGESAISSVSLAELAAGPTLRITVANVLDGRTNSFAGSTAGGNFFHSLT